MIYKFKQCVNSVIFKYFNGQYPNYLSEVFNVATESNIQLRGSFQKLKCHFCKINSGQFVLFYIGSTFRNKTPDRVKRTGNLNAFKQNLKKHFLNELKN